MAVPVPYPVFVDLSARRVLIVGGGEVALRKARGLVQSGGRVTVVSPRFAAGFSDLPQVEPIEAPYSASHMGMRSWRLVFAATNRPKVNAQVQKHAQAAGIWCCRCDAPEEGDFSGGATRQIGSAELGASGSPVVLAVSTAGASPALAARIADEAARGVDAVHAAMAQRMGAWRKKIKLRIVDPSIRRDLLGRLCGENMEETLRAGGPMAAEQLFESWFAAAAENGNSAPKPARSKIKMASRTPARPRSSGTVQHAD